jgi:hypothetical protein
MREGLLRSRTTWAMCRDACSRNGRSGSGAPRRQPDPGLSARALLSFGTASTPLEVSSTGGSFGFSFGVRSGCASSGAVTEAAQQAGRGEAAGLWPVGAVNSGRLLKLRSY